MAPLRNNKYSITAAGLLVLLILIRATLSVSDADSFVLQPVRQSTNVVSLSTGWPDVNLDGTLGSQVLDGFGSQTGYLLLEFPKSVRIDGLRVTPKDKMRHDQPYEFAVEGSTDLDTWYPLKIVTLGDGAVASNGFISLGADDGDRYRFVRMKFQTDGTQFVTSEDFEFVTDHTFVKNARWVLLVLLIGTYFALLGISVLWAVQSGRLTAPLVLSGSRESRQAFVSSLVVVLACITIASLAVIIVRGLYQLDEQALIGSAGQLFEEKYRFALWPKPVERLIYIVLLVIIPVTIVASYFCIDRYLSKMSTRRLTWIHFLAWFMGLCLLVLLIFFDFKLDPSNFLVIEPHNYYSDTRRFVSRMVSENWIVALLALPICLYLVLVNETVEHSKWFRFLFWGVIFALLATVFVMNLFGRDTYPGWYEHFNAVFYALAQVVNGSTLLVDLTNQYGLFPHFLDFLFQGIGLNARTYSFVMACLVVVSYSCVLVFMARLIKNRALLLLGFVTLVHFRTFFLAYFTDYDAYFQYTPVRFLFPCILLLVAVIHFQRPSKLTYCLGCVIGSISIFWNVDTGLFVFVSWILTQIFIDFLRFEGRKCISLVVRHVALSVCTLLGAVALYSLWMLLRSGQIPDFSQFLRYQGIFYGSGFYMMNTPVFNAWNLVVLVYVLGLIDSYRAVLKREQSTRAKAIFLLSILGIGLFTYYQGRSHDYVLLSVHYPALILVVLFVDRISEGVHKGSVWRLVANPFVLIFFAIQMLALSHLLNFSRLQAFWTHGVSSFTSGREPNEELTQNLAFLRRNTSPGEKIVVLVEPGFYDGIYFADSKTRNAISVPGASERVLVEDTRKIRDFLSLNRSAKVFVNRSFDNSEFRQILASRYFMVNSSGDLDLFLPR